MDEFDSPVESYKQKAYHKYTGFKFELFSEQPGVTPGEVIGIEFRKSQKMIDEERDLKALMASPGGCSVHGAGCSGGCSH